MSSDFPGTTNGAQNQLRSRVDAVAGKLSPDGSTLEYATYFGGNDDDFAYAIDVDPAGSAYIGGDTQSDEDFPVGEEAYRSGQPILAAQVANMHAVSPWTRTVRSMWVVIATTYR